MRIILSLLIILINSHIHAQNLLINYESVYDGTLYKNQLITNDSISIWEMIFDPQATDKADELLVKNYSLSTVVLIDYIFQKQFFVVDTLHPMIWQLGSEEKNILGYQCHSANTIFRGRSYVAYYTKDIPFNGGPWKFGGLQGLILEVTSADGNYSFRATDIQPGDKIHISEYDLHPKDQLSWQEYCTKSIHTINQYINYMRSVSNNPGSQIQLRIDRPEIIYPAAQYGTGISSD